MQLAFASVLALVASTQVANARTTPMAARNTSLNPRTGSWLLEFYESGCDAKTTGATAGGEDDEIWCKNVSTSHNVAASNIGNMDVWLYADWHCEHQVAYVGRDGCTAIPLTSVIEAVRVLPRKK
ncbi:uncharacterized protein PG986_002394 [Apiospora aurea]|uniref:Uncharacterized protein n=1 Tax=Apiospora aurea TaxID=335848 RepID=A0ABR1QNP8_9PEZI